MSIFYVRLPQDASRERIIQIAQFNVGWEEVEVLFAEIEDELEEIDPGWYVTLERKNHLKVSTFVAAVKEEE